jgi:hypothetical protein
VKYWRCAIRSTLYGRTIINSIHVKADPGGISGDQGAEDVANDVWAWLDTDYKSVLATEGTVLDLTATEEIDPGGSGVPDAFVKAINEAGTFSTVNNLPVELTMHLQSKSGVPVRGSHGGIFLPPPLQSLSLSSDGLSFLTSNAYWTNAGSLIGTLLAGADWTGVGTGHYSYVIYSKTRRARGLTTYAFDVTSIVRNPFPTWLRSRAS